MTVMKLVNATLRPLSRRVVARPVTQEEVALASGIVIPATEQARSRIDRGEVVAVAEDAQLGMKVGDEIVFNQFAAVEVMVDGSPLLILHEDDVTAVVERKP